jgi:hypothetical protein
MALLAVPLVMRDVNWTSFGRHRPANDLLRCSEILTELASDDTRNGSATTAWLAAANIV